MSFRENLKEELTFQDIKVKELAERTGISKHTIDHYLATNGSQPQAELAVKIARALNVTVEYLVLGKDESKKQEHERDISIVTSKLSELSDRDFQFVKKIIMLL